MTATLRDFDVLFFSRGFLFDSYALGVYAHIWVAGIRLLYKGVLLVFVQWTTSEATVRFGRNIYTWDL